MHHLPIFLRITYVYAESLTYNGKVGFLEMSGNINDTTITMTRIEKRQLFPIEGGRYVKNICNFF